MTNGCAYTVTVSAVVVNGVLSCIDRALLMDGCFEY